jgi:hypothetical protein
MGRMFVASVLMSVSRKQPADVVDTELGPIVPGAWAAWAGNWESEQVALAAASQPDSERRPAPTATPLPAGSKG